MKRSNQRGIGLLELMLSLAIIAILLIMATRYYQTTKQSQEVNDAVQLVNSLVGAMSNYRTDHPTKFKNVSVGVKDLTDVGYLPSAYGDGKNTSPWRTSIGKSNIGNNGEVYVNIYSIPYGACQQLAGRLSSSCQIQGSTVCGCQGSGATAQFKGNFGTSAQ